MTLDSPHASWHPALMPNSAAELKQLPRQQPPPSDLEPDVSIPDESADVSTLQEDAHDPFDQSAADDAWFPEYDAGGEHAPAAAEVAQAHGHDRTEVRDAEPTQAAPEAPAEEQDAEAGGHASKHLSTTSFARTVPHEFNWNDDEDGEPSEPNLQTTETETDPFKFMPPNDRTNSFPVVPPLQSPHPEEIEHPLSADQAQDIVDEVERQDENEEAEEAHKGLASAFDDTNDDDFLADLQNGSDQQQYIGGNVQGSNEEASDARYAEGLPLVGQDGDTVANEAANSVPLAQEGLAEDFAADEDDFFSQVQKSASAETQEPEPAPLERKSTMQVLNEMGMGQPAADLNTLEESPAEDDRVEDIADATSDAPQEEPAADLDAKWKEVFAQDDDDDFLLDDTSEEKAVDPAAFFGDDDEGFLEDEETSTEPTEPASATSATPVTAPPTQSVTNRYLPTGQAAAASTPANPYLPAASPFAAQSSPRPFSSPAPGSTPPVASAFPYGAPPPRPEPKKAESFVDKRGGYQSPYDLPMEVVKPRKRVSMQNLQRTPTTPLGPPVAPPAPPRSTSMYAQAPPARNAGSIDSPALSPPSSSQGPPPATAASKGASAKAKEAFFEDLPMVAKARPASRHGSKGLPSPSQTSQFGPPLTSQPPAPVAPSPAAQYLPPHPVTTPSASGPEIPTLVAPARVSPYAPLQSSPSLVPSVPSAQASRYSPAPPGAPHMNGMAPPAPPSRYSPAPPGSRPQSSGYGAAAVGPAPPVLPHQPRTSSPLAHFEISHDRSRLSGQADSGLPDRRGSYTYEQRLQRVPSLPPTREVEEDEGAADSQTAGQAMTSPPSGPPEPRHTHLPYRPRQTPPPALSPQASLSPPKRTTSDYTPSGLGTAQSFAPPQRSQTQSPGALYGRGGAGPKPVDPIPRPSSVHAPAPHPTAAFAPGFPQSAPAAQTTPTATRQRGLSQNFNLVAPTDGREYDPLQRWKGVPVVAWGVGGTVVTSFPKDVPRYGMGQAAPMVIRSPGEVKVQTIKDLEPLEERLSKFPGPLKGKSKKKETLAWLAAGIENLEANLPRNITFRSHVSHEDKRGEERVLLWHILRLFVEHDGVLDGNATVEQAVRGVLSPNLASNGPGSPLLNTGAELGSLGASGAAAMRADAVDPASIEELRNYLLSGDREKAVWAAADKRLWGHALLVANTVSQDLYKKVTQEFVKKEVNSPGHNNESLAALYEVLSGNHEDCVDELVPVHARAGLQLLAKDSGLGATKDVAEGLDKWRETLSLILSNRSADDARAIKSLGELLSSYGRAEAAHICFIFAKNQAVFGGLDDPNSDFVLVGSDHRRQADQFAKETEPLLLSEVYEYGLSLAGGSHTPVNTAHLAGYKYQHALTLAEYGFKDKALQYCDAISNAIAAQTRRSPYHHALLEAAVDDLSKRLKLAPKEGSNSWIPKPSMNKVSDSVWNRFNKFVAGDDNEGSGQGSPTHGVESGPFARISGGTPMISRPPSAAGLETFGTVPGYPMVNGPVAPQMPPAAPTRTASRYAPSAQSAPAAASPYEPSAYAPRSSMERTSSEFNRSSFEMSRPSMEMQRPSYANAYMPDNVTSPAQGFQPVNGTAGSGPSSLSRKSSYVPVSSQQESQHSQPPRHPSPPSAYQPQDQLHGKADSASNGSYYPASVPAGANIAPATSGYQPPSYGYEPPSLTSQDAPQEAPAETKEEPQETNGGYEAPSYQPYGYEPPSYEPEPQPEQDDSDQDSKPKPKKRGPMYDDEEDDELVVPKTREKTKEEKDRENAEMFRKIAEEEAKRSAEAAKSQPKKGWLGGWFGGKKESSSAEPQQQGSGTPGKPIRAKLGEANSFYYDPEQKRWVNKNASAEDQARKTATPPPPRGPPGGSASARSTPPPPHSGGAGGEDGRASAPPGGPPRAASFTSAPAAGGPPGGAGAGDKLTPGAPPAMTRSGSNTSAASGPSSRPTTSMSNASSIDDLLGAVGPRVKGAAKKKKGGRYVDVMAKP